MPCRCSPGGERGVGACWEKRFVRITDFVRSLVSSIVNFTKQHYSYFYDRK